MDSQVTDNGKQQSLLIVENEFLIIAPTVELLRDYGYIVFQSADGMRALQTLAANPQIEVIAVDIGLPDIDGNEVVRRARTDRPDLKALIVTGYDTSIIEIPEGPDTSHLAKPFDPDDFVSKVNSLFGKLGR